MPCDDVPLPQREHQQDGWEDKAYEIVGDEDYAECDDDERHQHYGRVNPESALYLVSRQTDEQGEEDGAQQPGILDEQLRRHEEEVVIHEHAGYHHRYGEYKHCYEQYQAHLLLHEVLGAETLRHQPSHEHVAEQGCQEHIDDDEDAQTHYDWTAPLRVDLTLAVGCTHFLRVILLVDVRLGVVIRRRHGGDDLQIVLVAVHEDVVLYVVISLQGIVVHLLQLLRHALVVLRVLLHGSPHLDEVAAERIGVCKAGVAVRLSCLVEHKRQWHLLAVLAGDVFLLLRTVLAVLGRFASE